MYIRVPGEPGNEAIQTTPTQVYVSFPDMEAWSRNLGQSVLEPYQLSASSYAPAQTVAENYGGWSCI